MLKKILPFCLVFAAVAGFVVTLQSDSMANPLGGLARATKDGGYKLATKLEVVMEISDSLFYGMPEYLKANKFKTLNKQALFLAEMGHLFANIEGEKDWDSKDWDAYSVEMKDSLIKLADIAKKKDAKAFDKQYKRAEEACESCHEDFRD